MNRFHSKSSKCSLYVSSGLLSSHPISIHLTKTCLLGGIKGPLRFYLALGKKAKTTHNIFLLPSVRVQFAPSEPSNSLFSMVRPVTVAMYHLFGNYRAWVKFHTSGPAKLKRTLHITHFVGISTKSPLFVGAYMLGRFSRVQLFATLWTVAHQAPLSMASSRQEYWSGMPFSSPGDLPDPGIEPEFFTFPGLAGKFFTTSATWMLPLALFSSVA